MTPNTNVSIRGHALGQIAISTNLIVCSESCKFDSHFSISTQDAVFSHLSPHLVNSFDNNNLYCSVCVI